MKYIYKKNKKFPYIHRYLIIREEDLVCPMIWPNRPFVYQFLSFCAKRPLPPEYSEYYHPGLDWFDTINFEDGTAKVIFDQDLIYYNSNQKPVFVEQLVLPHISWAEVCKRILGS